MAQPALTVYSVGAGQPINGGRYAGGLLLGALTLDGIVPAGSMASNASDISGGVTLDDIAPAGTFVDNTPAWLQGQPTGQWISISGTVGPGAGLNTNAYSDMTIDPATSRVYVVAAGGHSDGSSNAAAMIDLSVDAPAWTTLRSSSSPTADALYYGDGRPTSRHTYHHTHWIPSLGAVLLAGCRFGYGGGTPSGWGMDLFDVTTGDYLPRFTWPDSTGGYGVVQDGAGNIWTVSGYKANATTGVMTKPGSGSLLRYPAAYDSIRDKIFALQFDDGEGFGGAGLQAKQLDPATGNSTNITFNSSAALTQFLADGPDYAAMAYCPVDGKFYFLHPGRMGTLYVVTPNAGTTWDMATLVPGGASVTSSGVLCKRLLWVPALRGFVLQHNQSATLKFLRLA